MQRNHFLGLYGIVALLAVVLTVTATLAQGPLPQASEEHKILEHEAGIWDAEMKIWHTPDAEPVGGKAVETNHMLGSMWLVSEIKGDMMGMPFTGRGQYGYDPTKKKYIGTWIDNISPYLSLMEGTMDDSHKLTMLSKGRDFQTGEIQTTKLESTYPDQDHKTFTMFAPVPDKEGEWWKMMEIHYTKRK